MTQTTPDPATVRALLANELAILVQRAAAQEGTSRRQTLHEAAKIADQVLGTEWAKS